MKQIWASLLGVAVGMSLQAATVGRQEVRDGETYLVLENESAKVVVWPAAGGAITDYIDKRSGVDFAAKPVTKGKCRYGWKDVTALDFEGLDLAAALPYQGTLTKGSGYSAIVVTCTSGWLRIEREMRLDDGGTTLTVVDRHTNIAAEPRTIWLRFHPFMTIGDPTASHSAILVPGPEPQTLRRIGTAYPQDANYLDVPGYWMAGNASNGVGMWMTFDVNEATTTATWSGDKGGSFTAEIRPKPARVAPGASVVLHAVYQPFASTDKPDQLAMDLLPEASRPAAKRFAALARANLGVLAPYSMGPSPQWSKAKFEKNRFNFSVSRRDRFALLDWGIMDAMMGVPADQSIAIRLRLYAQAFDGFNRAFTAAYKLTVTDTFGKVVKEQRWKYEGTPDAKVIDKREDVPIADLPDGRYTFVLEAFDSADATRPVHRYVERRKLAGTQLAAMGAARVKAEQGVPLERRERPFVTALRTVPVPAVDQGKVPIGVEEAGGLARQNWPVRVGVPFAAGVLAKNAAVALTTPDGSPVPAQTSVMGTWLDGSVKWLLVDFPATVPANGHVFYTLKANAKPTAAAAAPLAVEEGGRIRVDSGAGQWTFSAGDSRLLGLFGADDIWWKTADGRNYRFEIKGEEAGISVVENGPQRAVVKVVGWYMPPAGVAGDPIARGEFRAEFCRGQAWFRLYHTFTFAGDAWTDALASTGVRFSGLLAGATEAGVELDGQVVLRPKGLSLWQADDDHATVESGDKPVGAGRRSTGVAVLQDASRRAVVYHRHLWEMFPKTVSVDAAAGSMAFEYWPQRAGALDWRPREDGWMQSSASPHSLGVGASRTHEFIVAPSGVSASGPANPLEPAQYRAAFDEPVIAVVAPRYLCATKALFHLQPYDPNKVPELEALLSEGLGSWILNREAFGWYGQWAFGTLHNWFRPDERRWADYGRYCNLMNEQDILVLPWLAYLRSGDRQYLKLAEANTRHLMEVGTIRWSRLYPEGIGMSRRHHECAWLGCSDYGHSMLEPFLELYHATGYRPGLEAAERMARAKAKSRGVGLEGRYLNNQVTDLARMYLETQDPFYKKEADRLWTDACAPDRGGWYAIDHGSRMAFTYSQVNEDCKRAWKDMADPESAWNKAHPGAKPPLQELDSLAMLYQQTGDKRIAQRALRHFQGIRTTLQANDPSRSDPFRWVFSPQPQMSLSALRPLVYSSAMLADALKDGAAANAAPDDMLSRWAANDDVNALDGAESESHPSATGRDGHCCGFPEAVLRDELSVWSWCSASP